MSSNIVDVHCNLVSVKSRRVGTAHFDCSKKCCSSQQCPLVSQRGPGAAGAGQGLVPGHAVANSNDE